MMRLLEAQADALKDDPMKLLRIHEFEVVCLARKYPLSTQSTADLSRSETVKFGRKVDITVDSVHAVVKSKRR